MKKNYLVLEIIGCLIFIIMKTPWNVTTLNFSFLDWPLHSTLIFIFASAILSIFFCFFFSSRETFLVSFTFFRDLHFWLVRFKPWDKFCRKDDGSQNLSQTHYITSRLQLILFSYVSSVYKSKVFIIPVMRLTNRLCLRIYDNYTTLFSILSDYWIIHEVSIGSWNISIALMASSWLLNYFFISISLWGTTHLCQFVLERTKWSFKSYLR